MRIISQNLMDFPYEQIVVSVDDSRVICRPVNDMGGRYYTLGIYRDEERAEEVFNTIGASYNNPNVLWCTNGLAHDDRLFVMPEE